ncbi:MAG: TIGR00266 family protein [Pseudomonadota bacterium]
MLRSDVIDYKIHGNDMQYVEVELDPGEATIAEAGTMMFKSTSVEMTTISGDGTGQTSGILAALKTTGKRVLAGESLFSTVFTNMGRGKARVAFAAPYPGTILPMDLSELGGTLICQKDAFLAAAKGVSIDIALQRNIMAGLFGGEGFILQKLEGDGLAFIHAGGTVREFRLKPGGRFHVDTGCLVAMEPSVTYEIERAGSVKSMLFGGEGFFFVKLTGPGRVWLQSLPFARLAERAVENAYGSSRSGEGSVLGMLGDLVDGDG